MLRHIVSVRDSAGNRWHIEIEYSEDFNKGTIYKEVTGFRKTRVTEDGNSKIPSYPEKDKRRKNKGTCKEKNRLHDRNCDFQFKKVASHGDPTKRVRGIKSQGE